MQTTSILNQDIDDRDTFLRNAGKILIHQPVVYKPKEEILSVSGDKKVAKMYDFYWIDFAFTAPGVDQNDASALRIAIRIDERSCGPGPESCIAMDLIPLKISSPVEVENEYASPDLEFETKLGTIKVGELFKRTTKKTIYKPKVEAQGLQSDEFAWQFLSDEIGEESKRVTAVVRVPKGKTSIGLTVQGLVRGAYLWGEIPGFWAVSSWQSVPISLQ